MKQKEKTALTKMQKEHHRKSGLTDTELKYLKSAGLNKEILHRLKKKTGGRAK
tara:strand:- start:52 stop:210 length:159 start_codon:yes stop_codon:yes gene_type:complete